MGQESKRPTDKTFIILGFTVIGLLFVIYARISQVSLTPEAIDEIHKAAFGFYVTILFAFGSIAYGMYRYHKRKIIENKRDVFSIIALTTWNSKSRKIFVLTFIGYGIFFSLTSGILVYQPDVVFSYHYGAQVPSAHITPCCGEPGYMPKLIVYITEHVGLQIIPINLVLQIVVSYLVGLNTSLAVSAYSISKNSGGLTGIGATTGLFIACPTCVGTFLSLFITSSSAIAFTVALTQIQTLFIAITIPILIVTPMIIAKKIRDQSESCAVDTDKK